MMKSGEPRSPLPRLLLVADRFTQTGITDRVVHAARAGVPWIQLRDHAADDVLFERAADELLGAARRQASPPIVSVNSRIAFADTRGTAFHTGTHGPSVAESIARLGQQTLVGVSVHSVGEALRAREQGVAYVIFSPVYETSSKPGHPGTGTADLGRIARLMAPTPVLALGGVTLERVPECLDAGAHGVATVSGILGADDIERAVRLYLDSITIR